ncbi:60S acidic ribosomal protein P0 [Ramicandelaber brevisporus]|nr:60S acidic ribosomal protein P0 [Ramicandelaber brevisporus]
MSETRAKKAAYAEKLRSLLLENASIFIVQVDNVGSNQMHQIRKSLRGDAEVLMGKNTMVRRLLREMIPEHPQFERLVGHVKGNTGFVFTNGELKDIRDRITENRVRAPAKAGAIAPVDVSIPAGNTGMEPGKTSFFQALGIPTKIARGTIEITNEVHLIHKGNKVGASEATLLNMLNISPFTYGMSVVQIFADGNTFPPSVLDIEESELLESFMSGVTTIAALSLQIDYPTVASVPHTLINVYKNLLAVSVATDYTFAGSEQIKAYLADPSAFAVAAPTAAADAPAAAAAEKEEAVEEDESDADMGFGLFD